MSDEELKQSHAALLNALQALLREVKIVSQGKGVILGYYIEMAEDAIRQGKEVYAVTLSTEEKANVQRLRREVHVGCSDRQFNRPIYATHRTQATHPKARRASAGAGAGRQGA